MRTLYRFSEKTQELAIIIAVVTTPFAVWALGMWMADTAPILLGAIFVFGAGFAAGRNTK